MDATLKQACYADSMAVKALLADGATAQSTACIWFNLLE